MAVNRKTLLPALACALLVFSMLGCGATNHLQSITLSVTSQNGVSLTSQSGVYTLLGDGGTLQLAATGNYNNGKTKDLTNQVAFTMIVDPNYSVDAYNHPLPAPPATAQISTTGLITAVEPATCTWVDPVPAPGTASWFFMGAYQVTASLDGVTSQPAYIPVASQAGNQNYIFVTPNLMDNNPSEQCGPTPLQ